MQHTVWIILPAFNESEAIGDLLGRINEFSTKIQCDCKVVIVDDGSSDDTVRVARQFQGQISLEFVQHPENRGLGAALRSGFMHVVAQTTVEDIVVVMDADDTQSPFDVEPMIPQIRSGADIVIGSRYQKGSRVYGVPRHRRLYSRVASWLLMSTFSIPQVRDYTCGFRAYRAEMLQRAVKYYGDELVSTRGFECMVDVLWKLHRFGAVVRETPITLHYDRKKGPTKMNTARTIWRTVQLAWQRCWKR